MGQQFPVGQPALSAVQVYEPGWLATYVWFVAPGMGLPLKNH